MNIEIKPGQVSPPANRRRPSSPSFCKRSKNNRHAWVWKTIKSVVDVWYMVHDRHCTWCHQHHANVFMAFCKTCGGSVKVDANGIPLARWCGLCQAGREHHETVPRADI